MSLTSAPPASFSLAGCLIAVGAIKMQGFGDGNAIEIEAQGDAWVTIVGVDGSVARAATNNTLSKVTIKLLQTAPANAKMSQIFLADTGVPTGLVVPFVFRDLAGSDQFTSPFFWVNKRPKIERGAKIATIDWECMAAESLQFLGGALPTPTGL
jgi:hypothetical protein